MAKYRLTAFALNRVFLGNAAAIATFNAVVYLLPLNQFVLLYLLILLNVGQLFVYQLFHEHKTVSRLVTDVAVIILIRGGWLHPCHVAAAKGLVHVALIGHVAGLWIDKK